jgi:hypothetical protein
MEPTPFGFILLAFGGGGLFYFVGFWSLEACPQRDFWDSNLFFFCFLAHNVSDFLCSKLPVMMFYL